MSQDSQVHDASGQFYKALNLMLTGDAQPMEEIWSHGERVTALHPIGGRQVGWPDVRKSWEQVAQVISGGEVKLKDPLIQVVGDVAYEVGVEEGEADFAGHRVVIEQRVTNIYRRQAEGWRIVHHHSDLSPAMIEEVKRLQAKR
jgi:ketosteroid isomerase-like protein